MAKTNSVGDRVRISNGIAWESNTGRSPLAFRFQMES